MGFVMFADVVNDEEDHFGRLSDEDQCEGLIGDKVFQCSSSRIYGDFFIKLQFPHLDYLPSF